MSGMRMRGLRSRGVVAVVVATIVVGALLAAPAVAGSVVGNLRQISATVYEAISTTFWSGTGSYASKTKIAAGDVDGNGSSDVFQFYRLSTSRSAVYLLKSNGASMAKSTAWAGTMPFAKTQIAAGDYDGDGKCDLFLLYDRGSSTCSLYVMTSTGTALSAPREIFRSASGAMAFSRARLTAGDPDHDNLGEAIVYYESGSGHASIKVIGKGMLQVQGDVVAAQGGSTLPGVNVALYSSGGTFIGSAVTDSSGSYAIPASAGPGYRAVFSASGYLTATYYNITIAGTLGTTLETVKLVASGASGAGGASGFIKNAFDGSPLGNMNLRLHVGYNAPAGALAGFTAVTATDGSFSFAGVPGGYYTAEVYGTGFTTNFFTIIVVGGTTMDNQNMSITPILTGSDVRFVLTWGASPADIDSHLTGPPTSGSTRFHVYWSVPRYPASTSVSVVAILDVDQRHGFGPETITLSRTSGGVYRYSVHDYTNKDSSSSSALAVSGAQVRVYKGSSLLATYNVPNHPGTLWTVLEISGSTITPINSMSYHPATDTVP